MNTPTRAEHLAWCKARALKYLDAGNIQDAVVSMLSDIQKHSETAPPMGSPLNMLGLMAAMNNDHPAARRFIEGFN